MDWKETILRHIDRDYTEPVRDTLWSNILLSPELKMITQQPVFQKLGRIKQLGPAFHVYPGATHTRLAHSFGVFHIAKLMIRKLIHRRECRELSVSGVKAFLCAALLHDLGHFPYAHSLKELPLKKHEKLTGEFILSEPLYSVIQEQLQLDPRMIAAIVDTSIEIPEKSEIRFFRNLLSGVLDPDKLDYLNRDAFFCGVPYGMQDIDFVLSRIMPHSTWGLALEEQGLNAVENILFSKYLMYKTVYWHKTVRIATAMVKKAVLIALDSGGITPEDLYGIDDEQFAVLFASKQIVSPPLIGKVTARNFFKAVYETDFDSSDDRHVSLMDIQARSVFEKHLAEHISKETGIRLSEGEVIVDIPEPISFEVNLQIRMNGDFLSFPDSGTVFTAPVVSGFTKSLRKIRIILPKEAAAACKKISFSRLI